MLLSIGGRGRDAPFLSHRGNILWLSSPSLLHQTQRPATRTRTRAFSKLVILSESGDCPDRSLRHADGHYHTGDLFLEAAPGCYISRGRDDDWIKSENSLRCDTKAIEDNVRMTCEDLVAECVVCGNGRPSPALFVEMKTEMDAERLKTEIIRRTRHFHSRRYLHERIVSTKFIVVVSGGPSHGQRRREIFVDEQWRRLSRLNSIECMRLAEAACRIVVIGHQRTQIDKNPYDSIPIFLCGALIFLNTLFYLFCITLYFV
ncbi:hypothetical protein A0H81_00898 [Grifola frondosa]|uniref:Uncharacterized protein n=1 Tax=Grifola frondosa TaxID=5627 RepID=A0A1C7MT32_GRIFR|nr:hypothetical protein A0H81_00898 [Grifola frondosa]